MGPFRNYFFGGSKAAVGPWPVAGGDLLEWYSELEANPEVRRWEKPKRATGDVAFALAKQGDTVEAAAEYPVISPGAASRSE